MGRPLVLLLLTAALVGRLAVRAAEPGDDLLGRPAPEWQAEHWLNSPPLELEDLRGRVVLVRFWTGPGCPYCRATAPALNTLHERFADRGLTVVGLYHHKSRRPLDPETVHRYARRLGFEFPVAIDPDWRTLRRWWLDRGDSGWTSVSVLLDRDGVIRWVHPGGQYVEGDDDFEELEAEIRRLLGEPYEYGAHGSLPFPLGP